MSVVVPRDYSLRVRMTPEEKSMLEALALSAGVSVSDWVRLTIRREFTNLAKPPKRAKK